MNEPPPNASPSTTEDVPATPGWVEQSVDEIFTSLASGLRDRPSLRRHRNEYLDCLAGAGRNTDPDEAHDRCRRTLLTTMVEQEGISAATARELEQKLEALEADITART